MQSTTQADPEHIRELGRVAMAARNAPVRKLWKSLGLMVGHHHLTSEAMHTMVIDCFTGERLVTSHDSGIPITHAVSASTSLPGVFGPTWLGEHVCMDGGIAASSTHCDLVMGAERVLVISLNDGLSSGKRLSSLPNTIQQELADLDAAGSSAVMIAVNPDPAVNRLDPTQVAGAIGLGVERAARGTDRVRALWS